MSPSNFYFTDTEHKKIIEVVSKYDCLYDSNSAHYEHQIIKANAWKKVAEHTNLPVDDCKKLWKNIRDTYEKLPKKGGKTGPSEYMRPLNDKMFFGRPDHKSISNMKIDEDVEESFTEDTTEDFTEDTTEDFIEDSLLDETQSITSIDKTECSNENTILENSKSQESNQCQHIKYNSKCQLFRENVCSEENYFVRDGDINMDVDVFFKSIAMSVKKLCPKLMTEAKVKSVQMLIDLERRNEIFHVPQQYSQLPSAASSFTSHPRGENACKLERRNENCHAPPYSPSPSSFASESPSENTIEFGSRYFC